VEKSHRRVAVTRKVDLAEYGDGLSESYAIVTMADLQEVSEISELEFEKMTNLEATRRMLDIAQKHFISGKIAILSPSGGLELVDMEPGDIQSSARIVGALYSAVMGVIPDPKDISTPTVTSPTPTVTPEL
jgi:hypothetical protein